MDARDKRNEIIEAAASCFARYGYEKTTLDDIGRLVGLNKASLYYYFKNKEELSTEVFYAQANAFKAAAARDLAEISDAREKVLAYLAARLDFIKHCSVLAELSGGELAHIAPFFKAVSRRLVGEEVESIAQMLESGTAQGIFSPCDTQRVAQSILMVAEAVRSRFDCRLTTEEALCAVRDETRFTVSLILSGLRNSAAV